MRTEADLARSVVRAARAVAATSPVTLYDLVSGNCPYCDGDVEDLETGFVHDVTCGWSKLAKAMAEYNVGVRVK